ncbi:GvpL/GvpF family gas vesicle protein [Sphaerisporangium aureirubrum]|uniref:GvpL/GvpF family gas vesicle protein n=1 Tax=Sphaerisporangium aureirubrum TaxID=1544736 RepID=A0ABW1NWH3_9ACTN
MSDTGTYLYAITREEDRADAAVLTELTGVSGAPVRAVERAGLVAYVSTVPLSEFGDAPLRRSLEDLDWVGETARAHHRVVETVAHDAATAPVRLVTVYAGDEGVAEMLDRRGAELRAVLSEVSGRHEWGVKAYASGAARPAGGPPEEEQDAGGRPGDGGRDEAGRAGGPGTEYLRRRKAGLRSREDRQRACAEHAERIHSALAAVAVDCRRHRPQDPQLSGRDDPMLLNGAYLVDRDRQAEFTAVLDGLRGPGVSIELTGPWAPYSFTAVEPGPVAPAGAAERRDGG